MKVKPEGLRGAANIYSRGGRHPLTAMFGADETSFGGGYAVYCLFENKEKHDIDILKAEFDAGSDLHYPALTPVLPAAAWYERELHDMFGFIPDDHPDLRPLVLHETYPEDFHPLRKCVDIELIVRGSCCLIAGVPGATDHITVRSIVGRYLEHSRIYIFGSEGREKIYIASADFMTRNTLRRVEVAAPVYDEEIKARLLEMFRIMLKDNQQARQENGEGIYRILPTDEEPLNAQEYFYEQAYEIAENL